MTELNSSDPLFAAQAETMLEMLFGRTPGYVFPQLEGVDYRRCAEIADHLVATGRATVFRALYGGAQYRPSIDEFVRRADAEQKAIADVLALVSAQPDIHVDTLGDALPETSEQLRRYALAKLLADSKIREIDGQLVTAELAAERDADRAAEDWVRAMPEPVELEWLRSTGLYREQSIDRAVAKLEASGDLEHLPDGRVEVSTALDRRMRELVIAASTPSFLKRAPGVTPADVAHELEIDEEQAAMALYRLMLRGWFTRDLRGNAFHYLKA